MTTATFSNDNATLRHYFADLAMAARAFADALFAAQARQFVVQEVRTEAAVTPAVRARSLRQMFALARDVEYFSPNLAAELRTIAGRD